MQNHRVVRIRSRRRDHRRGGSGGRAGAARPQRRDLDLRARDLTGHRRRLFAQAALKRKTATPAWEAAVFDFVTAVERQPEAVRKSVGRGKSVSVRVDLGGGGVIKKKKKQ